MSVFFDKCFQSPGYRTYVPRGYSTALLLLSTVAILFTFKLVKKSGHVTRDIIKAERVLLYQTTFVTLWMIMANACDCAVLYLSNCLDVDVLVSEYLYEIMDICRLFANPGSLLFLFCISKAVRLEFYQTFNLCLFRPTRIFARSFPTVSGTVKTITNRTVQSVHSKKQRTKMIAIL